MGTVYHVVEAMNGTTCPHLKVIHYYQFTILSNADLLVLWRCTSVMWSPWFLVVRPSNLMRHPKFARWHRAFAVRRQCVRFRSTFLQLPTAPPLPHRIHPLSGSRVCVSMKRHEGSRHVLESKPSLRSRPLFCKDRGRGLKDNIDTPLPPVSAPM